MKRKNPKPLIIKKYENRRLYNTATSQYINQEQVAQLIRDGHDVHVIDAATGDDITRQILAQIVLDDAKTPESVFPLDVLRQMIVASGKATQDNALRYMKAMMKIYQDAYRNIPSPLNAFGLMPTVWPQPSGAEKKEKPGTAVDDSEETSDTEAPTEMEKLRRRVQELEATLARDAASYRGKGARQSKRTRVRRKP